MNAGKMKEIRTRDLMTGNQRRVTILVTTVTKTKRTRLKEKTLQVIAIYVKQKATVRVIVLRKERNT
jgi:hypothetical protein